MIPQTLKTERMQFITPCFCAGAEQTEPEVRAASLRGELRWWFRCLGGNREQEKKVFGAAAGGDNRSSSVALLVLDVKKRAENFNWIFESPPKQVSKEQYDDRPVNSSYITFFLSKAERDQAYLPPGTQFTLELRLLRKIGEKERELLDLAWDCMCNLGSIGARSTRGLGAMAPCDASKCCAEDLLNNERFRQYFEKCSLPYRYQDFTSPDTLTKVLKTCAQKLKDYRKGLKELIKSLGGLSVFGGIEPIRQKSAVRLRPYLGKDGELHITILKAPMITVSPQARKGDIHL